MMHTELYHFRLHVKKKTLKFKLNLYNTSQVYLPSVSVDGFTVDVQLRSQHPLVIVPVLRCHLL